MVVDVDHSRDVPGPAAYDRERLRWFYERMKLIRAFEERIYQLRESAKIQGSVHLSVGQEAVAAGVCGSLRRDDYITLTHRGHGYCLAKGVDPKRMMAEFYGRATGTNRGKGGSMHLADFSLGVLGANGVVGAGIPIALGAALSARNRGTGQVAVATFGDGAMGQGTVYECLNLAQIWKLPLIFVCENNGYAESTPSEYSLSTENIIDRPIAFNVAAESVDGMNVFAVADATRRAVERARAGGGPTFLEFKTYRYYGHFFGDDPLRYRTKEEEEAARARDCLAGLRRQILEVGTLTEADLDAIDQQVARLIDEAVEYAEASPRPHESELLADVYVRYRPER